VELVNKKMIKPAVLKIIRVYQKFLSPDQGLFRQGHPYGVCRYRPTCSEYAEQAIECYGVWSGAGLAIKRIFRCHPWHKGGYDPIK